MRKLLIVPTSIERPLRAIASACGFAMLLISSLACGGDRGEPSTPPASLPASTADAAPALEVLEPRVQLMPGMGAVYLRIVNSGDAADRLVAVETPIADVAETHESVEEDGVMRMVAHPQGFEIPAGGSVDLAPGGKHVMLIDPRSLAEGEETVPLTLRFESSEAIEVAAPVSTLGTMMADAEAHHGMEH